MTKPEACAPHPTTLRRSALVIALLAAIGPCIWFVHLVADVPGLIVLAAIVPALLYAWGIVQIDHYEPEPRLALAAALLGGAVIAAYLSHTINGWLLAWTGTLTSADQARPLAAGFGAPIVEEIAKAATLVALVSLGRRRLDSALDGIVYGALIGIGFAFTENVIYLTFAALQGGPAGLMQAVYTRALLGGFNHAAFTATTGAALGYAWTAHRTRGRWLVPAIGLALAIVQHVVWNAVASNAIHGVLCEPEIVGGPCRPHPSETSLFVTVPLMTAIFIGPGLMTLGAIAVLALEREARRRSAETSI
jgi:RsiW-degrading membrane proteinase PrsW (M82 family)